MKDTLFVRIPKTASRSVQDSLREVFRRDGTARFYSSNRHPDCRELMRDPDWPRFYKFSFVRNPWDRVVSAYCFKQTEKFQRALGVFYQEGQVSRETLALYQDFWRRRPNFNDWVLDGFERFFLTAKNQVDYLTDAGGRIAVDFVGRFERLHADFAQVVQHIGCPSCRITHHSNPTRHGPYTDYYTAASVRRVAEVFARDIDHFGYEYGG